MPEPLIVVVHSLDHAIAALRAAAAAGRPVTLRSAPGAALNAGTGWFRHVVAQAAVAVPGASFDWVLDCGDAPGVALAALADGVPAVRCHASPAVLERLRAIAAAAGGRLEAAAPTPGDGPQPEPLDLLDSATPFDDCLRRWAEGGVVSPR